MKLLSGRNLPVTASHAPLKFSHHGPPGKAETAHCRKAPPPLHKAEGTTTRVPGPLHPSAAPSWPLPPESPPVMLPALRQGLCLLSLSVPGKPFPFMTPSLQPDSSRPFCPSTPKSLPDPCLKTTGHLLLPYPFIRTSARHSFLKNFRSKAPLLPSGKLAPAHDKKGLPINTGPEINPDPAHDFP